MHNNNPTNINTLNHISSLTKKLEDINKDIFQLGKYYNRYSPVENQKNSINILNKIRELYHTYSECDMFLQYELYDLSRNILTPHIPQDKLNHKLYISHKYCKKSPVGYCSFTLDTDSMMDSCIFCNNPIENK